MVPLELIGLFFAQVQNRPSPFSNLRRSGQSPARSFLYQGIQQLTGQFSIGGTSSQGQLDRECRAFAQLAGVADAAAMSSENLPDNGHTDTRAIGFCRKERL